MSPCPHRDDWLERPDSPVELDRETGVYSLRVGEIETISPMFCTICGVHGRHLNPFEDLEPKCECGLMESLVQRAPEYVAFDTTFNEYLWLEVESHRLLYFCPGCGGQLPLSRRPDFFTKPTDEDCEEVMARIREIKTIADMRRILGEPSETFGPMKFESCGWKAHYTYAETWESLVLHVQEQFDGTVWCTWGGQLIDGTK